MKKSTRQTVLAYVDETSCYFLHAFCNSSILTSFGFACSTYPGVASGLRDFIKRGSGVGEGRGERSDGWLRIFEAMKDTSSSFCLLHTDALDVFNVGFDFHSRPLHSIISKI